jgi:UDP-4-amino-4,6-dideoxy-N-acetyl-beta-L-altrosamine transaminase
MDKPAIEGGKSVRESFLPYGKQWITEDEINNVVEVLQSDWITTGPTLRKFEEEFARHIGVKHAVAINSGTAALHISVSAAGIEKKDEVITTPFTFAATSNVVLFREGRPIFSDIKKDTYNIDPNEIKKQITPKTKAVIPVHFAGQPCDMDEIREIVDDNNLIIIDDACHALGAEYKGKKIGSLSELSTFSFHPVKHITTGEGGMVTTNDDELAELLLMFRNHGINKDAVKRFGQKGSWFYEMQYLGLNYRLTDIQAALGLSQLKRLPEFIEKRGKIAERYNEAFESMPEIKAPHVKSDVKHAWHLYVILLNPDKLNADRDRIFDALRAENIGVNVHYIPVHLHPYYREKLGYNEGQYPVTEEVFKNVITLPLFPKMNDEDAEDVITAVKKVIQFYSNK